MSDVEDFEPEMLEREGPKYFGMIRALWINAANKVELEKIRDKFGVDNISHALTFKNPLGVKAAVSVLLYLSITEGYADFFTDEFLDNVVDALRGEENVANYILITRLIRLLQTQKAFNDWIRTRGITVKENRLWSRLSDFEHHSDEDLRKETARAIKEGLRTNATEDQWCVIPKRVVEQMRSNIIWKITDIEDEELSVLSRGSLEGARGDEELARLQELNKKLKLDGSRKIAALEAELEEQSTERERVQNELNQVYSNIQRHKESLGESLQGSLSSLEPLSQIGEDNVNALRRTLGALGSEVAGLRKIDPDLRKRVQQGADDLKAIRQDNKVNDKDIIREDFLTVLSNDLAALQRALLLASIGSDDGLGGGGAGTGGDGAQTDADGNPVGGDSLSKLNRGKVDPLNYIPFDKKGGYNFETGGGGGRESLVEGLNLYVGTPVWASSSANPTVDEPLPAGWERKIDAQTSHEYYYHKETGATQWKVPK